MEQDVWQEIEQLYQTFQELGINEAVDYDKYYLYSLITHSTAIEGSTLTELDTQLLFDEGVTAKGKPLVHHLMNEDLKQVYDFAKAESELNSTMSYIYNSEADLSKMNNEYSNLKIRSTYYYITAPQDGYVVKALKQGIGETIKEGESIVSIMPLHPKLAVELYVKPMDVPLLQKGSKVRLQFDGWPALVFSGWPDVGFGTFGGRVAVIDNIDSKGNYRILVVPDPSEDPWPKPLRVGTGANGWAMLKDVPIYYEIWRQLNGFPPDYIEKEEEKKEKEKKASNNAKEE